MREFIHIGCCQNEIINFLYNQYHHELDELKKIEDNPYGKKWMKVNKVK